MASGFTFTEAMSMSQADLLMWTIAVSAASRENYDLDFDYDKVRWMKTGS